MNDQERQMLTDLHRALMEKPPGSGKDEKALIEQIRDVTRAYQRASWITRMLVWFLPALAGVGVAFQTIRGWFQ